MPACMRGIRVHMSVRQGVEEEVGMEHGIEALRHGYGCVDTDLLPAGRRK